jgi:hypothetical protein
MRSEQMPKWLAELQLATPAALQARSFPRREVLMSSVYYPASGTHGDVIAKLAPVFHSFIYVDYGIDRQHLDLQLGQPGFRGYHLVGYKQLAQRELESPLPAPPIPARYNAVLQRAVRAPLSGNAPYASWAILQRDAELTGAHGPKRFSLVFICADGAAAYHRLYLPEQIAPRAVAVIQPGHGFGGNYIDFRDEDGLFAWLVLQGGSPKPDYLLSGGRGHKKNDPPCWPSSYKQHVEYFSGPHPWSVWTHNTQ